ncbi:hypothetical protein ES707_13413 [subsurface metagenome]
MEVNKMQLVITIRKEVEDPEEGRHIYELVKDRLADRQDVTINGHVSNHFDSEVNPAPPLGGAGAA